MRFSPIFRSLKNGHEIKKSDLKSINLTFFCQKSTNFQLFSKIFQNVIKLIGIHILRKFQLIWTFFGQFRTILRHFGTFWKNAKNLELKMT